MGLEREEKLLNAIGLQTQRAATQRATDEIVQLNQRVSDLPRTLTLTLTLTPNPDPNPNPNPNPKPNPKPNPNQVSDLQRVSAECVAAQTKAAAEPYPKP